MNRETKRLMARQQMAPEKKQEAVRRSKTKRTKEKGRIRRYFGSVITELKAVDWPTRAQVRSYATVVFVTLVIVVGLIFLLNLLFSTGVAKLYG
ncbi:MAG: preprotein translocase subunit SecE [Ferrimicrobium sp.]|uniref:Protein translocase subunit SecE n=1 Tax=Ferrimicrobium acidiphilum TaxID=121039 RepID=A0ABV3XZX1_9ACTN|nr:preprotein translocase subunit SecE [Ferrimicrobium sp.]MCL5973415.1 preprotein translocase subunit SecE [Actinomycetota bacterium]